MYRLLLAGVAVSLWVTGCNAPGGRFAEPVRDESCKAADLQGTFAYMTDNALLADMTVGDMHFLPGRALLNDLGVQRLRRLASLMEAYGGSVRFNTALTDEELIARRIDVVLDFLAQAGVDTTRQVLSRDMPGGRGMDAPQALLIKKEEGSYDPAKRKESGGTKHNAGGMK